MHVERVETASLAEQIHELAVMDPEDSDIYCVQDQSYPTKQYLIDVIDNDERPNANLWAVFGPEGKPLAALVVSLHDNQVQWEIFCDINIEALFEPFQNSPAPMELLCNTTAKELGSLWGWVRNPVQLHRHQKLSGTETDGIRVYNTQAGER